MYNSGFCVNELKQLARVAKLADARDLKNRQQLLWRFVATCENTLIHWMKRTFSGEPHKRPQVQLAWHSPQIPPQVPGLKSGHTLKACSPPGIEFLAEGHTNSGNIWSR